MKALPPMPTDNEVHALLDWQSVVPFFRKYGPLTLRMEVKKTKRKTYIRWDI